MVDDEASAREVMDKTLNACGADLKIASSAAEALAILQQWAPQVLVSDLAMPGVDGYGLIQQIRKQEGTGKDRHLPAIALTAYASADDQSLALASGFDRFMAKPADTRELVSLIATLAGLP